MDLSELIDLLSVEPVGDDTFEGTSPRDRDRQVYGGQFLAQAVMAAAGTVELGRFPHSLHAYFVRTGAAREPIRYRVERIRDGRNFSHRSVVATQSDGAGGQKEVFRQLLSFQVPSDGLDYQKASAAVGDVDPADMTDYRQWVAELSDATSHPWFNEDIPVDLRIQSPPAPRPRRPIVEDLGVWMRLQGQVPDDDPVLHAALLAWISDKTISDVIMYPHGRTWTDEGADVLSLDHSLYFFEPTRADQWVLFTHEAPATGGGRGLARGDLFTLDKRRVGAISQEALLVV